MNFSRLLFFVCLLFSVFANAQDFSNKGKDFWLGYGYHVRMSTGNPINGQDMILYFTSDQNANVTVEIPSINYTRTYTVTANQVTVSDPIPKSGSQDARITDAGTFNTGIHITSDKSIVAYAHIYNSSVSGASLLFPTNTLGKDYYSINYTQSSNEPFANSFFFVVATEDNTTVEITPSAANKNGLPVNTPTNITLNKGQIYSVFGTTSGTGTNANPYVGSDLTGSRIRSVNISGAANGCKPIAVFSGAGKMSIGGNNTGSADNLFAQAFPSNAWGTKYLTAPTGSQPNNYFRICVKDPTTVVKLNGNVLPTTSLINNFYYQFKNAGGATSATPNVIESDKPILVAQYCTTQGQDGNPNTSPGGDPEMIYLSPIQQTINKITLYSATKNLILQSYINVIVKKEGVSSFTLDGIGYVNSFATHPGDNNYAYAIIPVSSGSHTLYSDSGFNAIAYGFGSAESYGYNAGTNVVDLNPPITIQNQYAASNISFSATCSNAPFKVNLSLTYQPTQIVVDFGSTTSLSGPLTFTYSPSGSPGYDSTYISNGKTYYLYRIPQVYTFNASGTYPVKLTTTSNTVQSDGCSNTNTQDFTDNVVVNAPPTADFTISSNGCANTAIALTDASDGLGRPLIKWNWEFSDATTASIQNPSKTFSAGGNYTAKLTAITDFGCIATATKNINVSAKPIASFTVPTLRCEKSSIVFTNTSSITAGTAGNTITRYNWNVDNGDGFVDVATNASQSTTYTAWGNKDVRLVAESNTGCLSDTFRLSPQFTINPLPQVGFVVPEVCLSAANATFTDTSKIADGTESGFVYSWKFNNGVVPIAKAPVPTTSSNKNPSSLYKDTGNYIVSLTITSNNGCIATKDQSFVVNGSNPVASFTVLTNSLCSNDSVIIKNTSTVDFGTITKLEIYWDSILNPTVKVIDDDPSFNKTYSNKYAKFFSPATKDIGIKIVAYSGNSSACARSANIKKVLNSSANLTFTKPRDICNEASSRQITQGSFTSLLNPSTAVYSGAGINANGVYNPQTVGAGTYALKYKVTNAAGCSDSASNAITVWPTPVAKWGVQTILCEKNSISFTDSSVANFSNIVQRKWNYGDGVTETRTSVTNFTRVYPAAQTYNVSLQVITDSGCVSTLNQQAIKVNPLPQPAFTLPNVVCLPDGRATFTNQSTIADGSESLFSYLWNFGDPSDATPSLLKDPTHKYSALGPVNVKLIVTSKDGCKDSLTKSFNNIYPWPKANLGMNVTTACVGDTVYFSDNGNGMSSSAVSWRWDLAQGFNAAVKNPSRQFNDSGTYTISYYFFNAQGCVSDTVSKDLTVYPYPKLTLPKRVNVLEGGNLKLKPIYYYGTNLSYMWTPSTYLNDPTDSTPVSTPLGDITYRLYLTGIGGCTVSDTVFLKLLLSPIVPNAFSPNGDGINDRWRIQYLESYPGATVDVYNRYGQLVFTSVGYSVDWDGTVNGNPLPIGTYYYVINPKNGRKIISGSVTIIR
jgi:gliding motility-associated-like protein